ARSRHRRMRVRLPYTTLFRSTPLPEENAPIEVILQRAFEILPNTAPFDCTHHPALSLPCGMVDGLPVGAMLIGKHYEEATIYQRSEEHTSELQSLRHIVCRLL